MLRVEGEQILFSLETLWLWCDADGSWQGGSQKKKNNLGSFFFFSQEGWTNPTM